MAKAHVSIPAGVEVKLDGQLRTVKGKKGELSRTIHNAVAVKQDNNELTFSPRDGIVGADAQAVTPRSFVIALVIGVTEGFTTSFHFLCVLF
ncbi:50S ribosomal protein L6, partial [Pasteurella multocida]|uniref:50S ribosomal protein L6 n=1 Tax=Pasteurella multocida TaxID=747 RepID=UPI00145AC783|nr:50S ribosomal protein L6 [Pasteurella multocida]